MNRPSGGGRTKRKRQKEVAKQSERGKTGETQHLLPTGTTPAMPLIAKLNKHFDRAAINEH